MYNFVCQQRNLASVADGRREGVQDESNTILIAAFRKTGQYGMYTNILSHQTITLSTVGHTPLLTHNTDWAMHWRFWPTLHWPLMITLVFEVCHRMDSEVFNPTILTLMTRHIDIFIFF